MNGFPYHHIQKLDNSNELEVPSNCIDHTSRSLRGLIVCHSGFGRKVTSGGWSKKREPSIFYAATYHYLRATVWCHLRSHPTSSTQKIILFVNGVNPILLSWFVSRYLPPKAMPWCQEQCRTMPNQSAANFALLCFETGMFDLSGWDDEDPPPYSSAPLPPAIIPLSPADTQNAAALPGAPRVHPCPHACARPWGFPRSFACARPWVPLALKVSLILNFHVALVPDLALAIVLAAEAGGPIAEANAAVKKDITAADADHRINLSVFWYKWR